MSESPSPKIKLPAFPTYVISLPRATDRRAALAKKMAEINLSYELVDATDEREGLSSEELKLIGGEGNLAKYNSNLVPGALGCLISHLRCYEKLLASEHQYVLIVEDDANFSKDFSIILNAVLAKCAPQGQPHKWQLINLGWWLGGEARPFIGQDTYPLNILTRRILHRITSDSSTQTYYTGRAVAGTYGSHCYLISRAGCRFALDNYPALLSPIDYAMNESGMPQSFLVRRPIAWQRAGEGDIGVNAAPKQASASKTPPAKQQTALRAKLINLLRRLKATLYILILLKPASYYKRKIISRFN